jgi:hypothetical protein
MKRSLETIQLLLLLASTTAVVDATRALAAPAEPLGYHGTETGRGEPSRDRRFGDLARLERRSREERQRAVERSGKASSASLSARVD